jgi:hypothetical protein
MLLPAVQKVREAAGRVRLVPMDDGVILLASLVTPTRWRLAWWE